VLHLLTAGRADAKSPGPAAEAATTASSSTGTAALTATRPTAWTLAPSKTWHVAPPMMNVYFILV